GERIDVPDRAVAAVVFQPKRDRLGEVPGDFCVGGEFPAAYRFRTGVGALQRGIDRPVEPAHLFVDNGANFEAPNRSGEVRPRIAELERQTGAHRPAPAIRCAHSWTDMIAHPLPALVTWHGGEDIEAGFEPVRPALSDFDGLVQF